MTVLNRFASGMKLGATNPRAGKSPDVAGPRRADRVVQSTSETATATGPGASGRKVDRSGNPSRFAHFAAVSLPGADLPEPVVDAPPVYGAMKVNAMRAEIAALGQRQAEPAAGPLYATAEGAARAALRAHDRAAAPNASAKPAAGTAEAVADATLATARRLGIIE